MIAQGDQLAELSPLLAFPGLCVDGIPRTRLNRPAQLYSARESAPAVTEFAKGPVLDSLDGTGAPVGIDSWPYASSLNLKTPPFRSLIPDV